MKKVLISIRPQWVEKICHEIGKDETGKAIYEKRIEVRKSAPKEVPFKCYIYETKESKMRYLDHRFNSFFSGKSCYTDMGKVIGEFICDKVYPIKNKGSSFVVENEEQSVTNDIAGQSCLYYDDMVSYFGNKDGYGWHISDLKIYDKPRELSEFYTIDKSGDDCCIACVHHETPVEEMPCKTCTGERRYLYRPPQSWQYVGEVGQTI